MADVWDNAEVEGASLLVLLALADYANENGICWPAVETLARKTRVSERHVHRILSALESRGYIIIGSREGPMSVNVYKILSGGDTMSGVTSATGRGWSHVTQTTN